MHGPNFVRYGADASNTKLCIRDSAQLTFKSTEDVPLLFLHSHVCLHEKIYIFPWVQNSKYGDIQSEAMPLTASNFNFGIDTTVKCHNSKQTFHTHTAPGIVDELRSAKSKNIHSF